MSSTGELDIWSGPIALMDLHVPAWKSSRKDATLLDHLRLVRQNIRNGFLNIRSMYRMAKVNSFQGVKIKSPWSWKLFTCQSPNNAWMFAFRQMALDMYKNINEAVANRDEKTIKAFSTGEQQLAYIKLARQQDSRFLSVWKLHGERMPSRVVSLRATEGHSGLEGPKIGNRLVVQALVRFDTMQSLELHSKKTGALVPGLDTNPKPVVEYLVFQKRMCAGSVNVVVLWRFPLKPFICDPDPLRGVFAPRQLYIIVLLVYTDNITHLHTCQ
ncbi:hypothetical protein A0H81_12631 [Grifola frondosa]|uniref:Uncharacterized protein n=1 Tax=Grifola frondosa TaxID=5627 RepID=A0A1C7LU64_GRIFR|nr:hypothetical protein A0H81_12631 [Grifola frondosa]